MKNIFIIHLFIIFFYFNHFAQIEDTVIAESEFENIFDDSFVEDSESDIISTFEDLLINPINLNTATIDELISIPFVDYKIASTIIAHRNKYGMFFSLNELYSISEIDTDIINKIIPFLKVETELYIDSLVEINDITPGWIQTNIKRINLKIRTRIGSDLQNREGFIKGKYLGSPLKFYNRVILNYSKNIQAGFTTEKDPGERSFNDFNSFHFSLKDIGILRQFILGDYNLEFGQGLILWSVYGFSKGTDAIVPIKKRSKGIKPYTGATEYGFFRGPAVNIEFHNFRLMLFYSSKKIDASLDSITLEIKSLPITGIHATEGELSRKNNASEKLYGSRLVYQFNNSSKFGVSFYKAKFSNHFKKTSINDLFGKDFSFYSFDFDNWIGPINLFGEIANDNKATAYYGGIIFAPNRQLQFTSSIRNYPKDFRNLHASGFGEQSGKTQNEFGFYFGIKFNSNLGLLNIYYDKFKFPYATFENPIPSNGDEFYLSYRKKISNKLEFHLRFKSENKEVTEKINNLKNITERIINSLRFEFDYFVNKQFKLRTRVEYNTYKIDKINLFEDGYLIYEDIKITPIKNLTLYGRIILFQTDSFNSAVYQFENDLTGLFSNLAMYGEGIRYYFIIKYKLFKNLNFSIKYAETFKPNEKFLSSGNNRINNNVDNRINFQIDLNL